MAVELLQPQCIQTAHLHARLPGMPQLGTARKERSRRCWMRKKVIAATMLCVGAVGITTLAAIDSPRRALLHFTRPTIIAGAMVSGLVVIQHDDAKMARGEACTTVSYYDRKTHGPGKVIVDFMCQPRAAEVATKTQVTCVRGAVTWPDRMIEYQLPGEVEAHGV